jgi:hypothetical protein
MNAPWPDDLSVGDALASLRRANALPVVPAGADKWSCKFGSISLTLPNFAWRRHAIDRHDLHHILINQPCNLSGECQVATWELAAGLFPNAWAQLFCLPLVAAGFALSPRRTWRTFHAGRRQRSLYGLSVDTSMRLGELRRYIERAAGDSY